MNKIVLGEIINWDETIIASEDLSVWSACFGIALLNHIPVERNMRVLDIGCGTGFPTLEISQRLGDTGCVYALDPWECGLDFLKKKASMRGITNIKTMKGTAEEIQLKNDCLDLIISNNGISACKDKKAVFDECYRVLDKKGRLIFTAILPESMTDMIDIIVGLLKDRNYISLDEKFDLFSQRKSISEYRVNLELAGFRFQNYEIKEFNMKFVNGTALVNYYMFRVLLIGQFIRTVPEEEKEKVLYELVERMNYYSELKGGIVLNIKYAWIEALKE